MSLNDVLTWGSSTPCSPSLAARTPCVLGGTFDSNSNVSTGEEKIVSTLTSLAPGGEECDNDGTTEMKGFGERQSFASRKEVCVATTR